MDKKNAKSFTNFLFEGTKKVALAYGENRYQSPAFLIKTDSDDPLAMHNFKWVSGDPGYISIADGSQTLEVMCRLAMAFEQGLTGKVPYVVVAGKHGNPCGAAIDQKSPAVAINKALQGNSLAVMGGEVITNFPITAELGQLLFAPAPDSGPSIGRENWGLDIVLAPSFDNGAVELLGKREKRRLLANEALTHPKFSNDAWMWRPVRGGVLVQKPANFILTPDTIKMWTTNRAIEDFHSLLIAWAVCWSASSNTVALAKDQMLIGLGCGQQDRIECVRLCLSRANRAGHDVKGSWFASDAFFPFAKSKKPENAYGSLGDILRDLMAIDKTTKFRQNLIASLILNLERLDHREGPELLIDAGCRGGVVPYDGKEKENVFRLFKAAGLSVAFLEPEHRGFAKH